jgi:hypothetical protein
MVGILASGSKDSGTKGVWSLNADEVTLNPLNADEVSFPDPIQFQFLHHYTFIRGHKHTPAFVPFTRAKIMSSWSSIDVPSGFLPEIANILNQVNCLLVG